MLQRKANYTHVYNPQYFKIPALNAHDALGDVRMTVALARALRTLHPAVAPAAEKVPA